MATFTMLIGLPASGKTTYSLNQIKLNSNTAWISSDAIRVTLFGNEDVQEDTEKVFSNMFKLAVKALQENRDVIYDATNLNRKLRVDTLKRLQKQVNTPFTKRAIVFYTDLTTLLDRNKARNRKVPDYVISRMLKCFDLPVYGEGWNVISVNYVSKPSLNWKDAVDYYTKGLAHENPHHILDVDAHMRAAHQYLLEKYPDAPTYVQKATLIHDIGKNYCKTFTNRRGETTEVAHFYQHANVGAYLALGVIFDESEQDKYKACILINYHMRPLEAWKDSEKAKKKDSFLLGEELFQNLQILSEADRRCENVD